MELLALLAMVPAGAWWLLAIIMAHGWAIELPNRSYGDYDPKTNTFKRNGKRDFPLLCLWIHGLLSGFCAFVLAPVYSPWWWIGALYFAHVVWVNRQEPRLQREERRRATMSRLQRLRSKGARI